MEPLKATLSEFATVHVPDLDPKNRPGVPMEALPAKPLHGAAHSPLEQQRSNVRVFRRKGLDHPTPVFGTAQPPRGLSGALKAIAYERAEDQPSHWALLLLSDRVNVIEGRISDAVRRPFAPIAAATVLGGLLFLFLRQRKRTAARLT